MSGFTASSPLPSGKTSSLGHDLSVVVLTFEPCWTPLHGSTRAGQDATNPLSVTRSPPSCSTNGVSSQTTGCSQPNSGAESCLNCSSSASWNRSAPEWFADKTVTWLAARHVAMAAVELVEHSLVVVVGTEIPSSLCVDDRCQRRRTLQRYDGKRAAGAHVVEQVPRASARLRLHELVAEDEVVRPLQPSAAPRSAVRLVLLHLREPVHDFPNAGFRVDVEQRRRAPVRVVRRRVRVRHRWHGVVRRRHVRHRERRSSSRTRRSRLLLAPSNMTVA